MKLLIVLFKRILYLGILLSSIQMIIFELTYKIISDINPITERGVNWGLFVEFVFLVFFLFLVFLNFTFSIFKVNWGTILISIILEVFYIYLMIPTFNYRPYRVLCFIFLSFALLLSSIYFSKQIDKKLPIDYGKINI